MSLAQTPLPLLIGARLHMPQGRWLRERRDKTQLPSSWPSLRASSSGAMGPLAFLKDLKAQNGEDRSTEYSTSSKVYAVQGKCMYSLMHSDTKLVQQVTEEAHAVRSLSPSVFRRVYPFSPTEQGPSHHRDANSYQLRGHACETLLWCIAASHIPTPNA